MKRKTLTIAICFLALISIVSIGFASWVISRPTTEQSAVGSITAEEVSVSGYGITLEWVKWDQTSNAYVTDTPIIHFGKPVTADESITNPWLTNSSDALIESFDATLKISISNIENMSDAGLNVSLFTVIGEADKALNDESTAFGKAVKDGYISMPTVKINDGSATSYASVINIDSDDFTAGYCLVHIQFGWGTKFGGSSPVNPYNYYNKLDVNQYGSEAETALKAIQQISTDGTKYKVLVAPAPATPQE